MVAQIKASFGYFQLPINVRPWSNLAMASKWNIHKFGGTSVETADRYKAVAEIIKELGTQSRLAVVVSAMKGVTDKLINLVHLAQNKNDDYLANLEDLKKLHIKTVEELIEDSNKKSILANFEKDFQEIHDVLRAVRLTGTSSEQNRERVSGYGEVWSAQLLNGYLNQEKLNSHWLDARQVLIVESNPKNVVVNWAKSKELTQNWFKSNNNPIVIITGFVASTSGGVATTLKRNGSDYSASIFGALLDAQEITIWTDVDGVFSADPRLVPEAIVLDELSYNETSELAYFGAKVVHPATMGPAMKQKIPIWIKNSFNPKFPGTKIHHQSKSARTVKGFSAIDDVALINIEGNGMVGVPGVAERLFSSLSRSGVSVIMISQASSEHSICFAVPQSQADLAKKSVEQAFFAEIHQGQIESIQVSSKSSILAIVGDNMVKHPGVAGRFFKSLGQAGINIKAIAQGSSERNISAVIEEKESARALRTVHSAFYLSDQTLSIGIIGAGLIGQTLLNQILERASHLKSNRQIDIRIRGIMNSRKMILDDRQIDLSAWRNKLENSPVQSDLKKFTDHIQSGQFPHTVLIDSTASDDIPKHYPQWLKSGLNIITPNKRGNTSDFRFYEELRSVAKEKQKYFIYSTNVGAGLPIIQTLRDLHQTGDRILSIEGIFSGTLSYIFNEYNGENRFSDVVIEAKNKGYTEPDPRDDLSGVDVARKLVILGREIGLKLELSLVQIESLVPENLRQGSLKNFLEKLPENDKEMSTLLSKFKSLNQRLKYVGTIDEGGKVQVKLKPYAFDHAFNRISGSENIVAFRTIRYEKQPLIIQGPGAGPEVTAAGVFADILRLASYLGAPQ